MLGLLTKIHHSDPFAFGHNHAIKADARTSRGLWQTLCSKKVDEWKYQQLKLKG